jgi:hypothetical protein
LQSVVKGCSKAAAAKVHASLLPAVAKSASDAAPDIREAAMQVHTPGSAGGCTSNPSAHA